LKVTGEDAYINGDAHEWALHGKHHEFFPAGIVRPNSSADVAGILKLANKHNVSLRYDFDNRRPSQILF